MGVGVEFLPAVWIDGTARVTEPMLIDHKQPARINRQDMDFDGVRQSFEVNAMGPLRCVQALLPSLKKGSKVRPHVNDIDCRVGPHAIGRWPRV